MKLNRRLKKLLITYALTVFITAIVYFQAILGLDYSPSIASTVAITVGTFAGLSYFSKVLAAVIFIALPDFIVANIETFMVSLMVWNLKSGPLQNTLENSEQFSYLSTCVYNFATNFAAGIAEKGTDVLEDIQSSFSGLTGHVEHVLDRSKDVAIEKFDKLMTLLSGDHVSKCVHYRDILNGKWDGICSEIQSYEDKCDIVKKVGLLVNTIVSLVGIYPICDGLYSLRIYCQEGLEKFNKTFGDCEAVLNFTKHKKDLMNLQADALKDYNVSINFTNLISRKTEVKSNVRPIADKISLFMAYARKLIRDIYFYVKSSMVILILTPIYSAFFYYRSFISNSANDNYMITSKVKEIDEKRVLSGGKSVFPVHESVSSVYTELFSLKLVREEYIKLLSFAPKLLSLGSFFVGIMCSDWFISGGAWQLLKITKQALENLKPTFPSVKVDINETGNPTIYTKILNSFSNFQKRAEISNFKESFQHCIPHVNPPAWGSCIQLGLIYLFIIVLHVLRIYVYRLRSVIACKLFPHMEELRSFHLYGCLHEVQGSRTRDFTADEGGNIDINCVEDELDYSYQSELWVPQKQLLQQERVKNLLNEF